jgi:hypothetical protein
MIPKKGYDLRKRSVVRSPLRTSASARAGAIERGDVRVVKPTQRRKELPWGAGE